MSGDKGPDAVEWSDGADRLSDATVPSRPVARLVGVGFLAAFLFYGIGALLVDDITSAADPGRAASATPSQLRAGVLLMLANSAIVAAIGVALYPILRIRHPTIAAGYMIGRAFEATVLAIGGIFVLMILPAARADDAVVEVLIEGNNVAYQIALLGLGLASLGFCWVLLQDHLVPRPLALLGLVGYAIFATGTILELSDIAVGTILSIPGGLFEVALGLYLIARGFQHGHGRSPAVAP